jgi:diguanylate cyclase (GGDEF)-like protein
MDASKSLSREAFVGQLPQRMAAVEQVWSTLHSGGWDVEQLDALYERVREIAELAKQFSLFQLNESAFSLEVYLSSFIGTDIKPDETKLSALDGLVRTLRTAVDTADGRHGTLHEPHGGVTIYALGDKGGVISGITDALRHSDCNLLYFSDAETLLGQLEQRPPQVILADTAMLPQMNALSAELTRLRSQLSVHIPLIFVSGSSALQLRVDAIRAGGDGFFVAPVDADAVAAHVLETAESQRNPYRVLIVEDDPTQAEFVAAILGKAGMQVKAITEAVKVMDGLQAFQPDLILMDIYMPEVNGIEMTSIIRDHAEFVTTPIVFVSGEQNSDRQFDALSVGGDDFIAKPIKPKHLVNVIETRVRRARQVRSATRQSSKHDRVTGLFSRQHFLDSVARLTEDRQRSGHAAVMVISPDRVDGLKDTVGVGGIDQLYAELGGLLHERVGDRDIAARLDDRAFAILAQRPEMTDIEALAQQILGEIAGFRFQGEHRMTASVGLCYLDDRSADATGIVTRASHAWSEAAEHGGNRVHTHSAEHDSLELPARGVRELGDIIRDALRDDSFVILYQPLLDLQNRGSETYEIVLRVADSQGDLVGGKTLLEAAAKAGLAEEMDRWILDRAIDILKQRRETGRKTLIFVHQSPGSALDPNLAAWVTGRLRHKQVVGTGLVMDFSLSDLSRDLKTAQSNIAALRKMDIEVALSRFPEKEAAFKVLRFLQATYISIAPRLLKADRDTISSVIRQAHDARARVIVSNVDDARSIDLHWSSGADYLQGNFIQRPLENMDYDFSQVVI